MNSSLVTRHSSLPCGASRRVAGFTLLEMLVVIVVMALLMGVTFRMVRPSEHARAISDTIKTINLANAAIAEYHAEYGIYPPVRDDIQWGSLTGGLNVEGNDGNKEKCGFVPGVSVAYFTPTHDSYENVKPFKLRDDDKPFCFGLVSFLVDRRDPQLKGKTGYGDRSFLESIYYGASQSVLNKAFGDGSWWSECGKGYGANKKGEAKYLYDDLEPSVKDVAFYKRIRSTMAKIIDDKGYHTSGEKKKQTYYYITIRDSFDSEGKYSTWGRDLVYICPPPFSSYALFSAGPDGKVVTEDPLNPDAECPKCHKFHNQDNVYSTVNAK